MMVVPALDGSRLLLKNFRQSLNARILIIRETKSIFEAIPRLKTSNGAKEKIKSTGKYELIKRPTCGRSSVLCAGAGIFHAIIRLVT